MYISTVYICMSPSLLLYNTYSMHYFILQKYSFNNRPDSDEEEYYLVDQTDGSEPEVKYCCIQLA